MPTLNDKQRVNVSADEPISVTVDASDLGFASAEPLRNIISRYGRPVIARAFADFQQPGLSDLAVQLYQMGFTLVHCPTWPNGDGFPKSVVSDVLAQDLRDQLEELEEVETFLLVATSREYIAVANALRRHDRHVVLIAEELKVCRELRLCAHEFAILPPARPTRSERSAERLERVAETAKAERAAETPRPERIPETARAERLAEPAKPEVAKPERVDPQEQVRLPNDAEVLAEVRRIVASEGICTPRRLARALCPVDRTPTGELRSRIANRIQALVDSGKLQRERLVVGGTSVETILARDERNGRTAQVAQPEVAPPIPSPAVPLASLRDPEPAGLFEPVGGDGMVLGDAAPEIAAGLTAAEQVKNGGAPARDLDALVESVLRAPQLASGIFSREWVEPAPEVLTVQPEPEPAPEPPSKPARSRSRRRTSPKAAAPEADATA